MVVRIVQSSEDQLDDQSWFEADEVFQVAAAGPMECLKRHTVTQNLQ